MEYLISEFISPTIITLIAVGVIYGLYRGFKGFWVDSAGELLAAIYALLLSPVLIFVMIKVKYALDLPMWGMLLGGFGLFWFFFWLGGVLFPSSSIFGNNKNDR